MDAPVALTVKKPALSGDRKVSPLVRRNASKDAVVITNSWGLPAGVSCPGRTSFCDGCYAERIEDTFRSSGRLMYANWNAVQACGDDQDALTLLIFGVVGAYQTQFNKALAGGRIGPKANIFRIHWDGDFYSAEYTLAWRTVMEANPDIQFWAYTRSFAFVQLLAGIANLALYLSIDADNIEGAKELLEANPEINAALCADTIADARVLADKLERNAVACPENIKTIPLVMPMSKRKSATPAPGDDAQGACAACGMCVDGKRDVMFSAQKR